MIIHLVEHLQEFEQLEAAWGRVFAADQHATVFLSWPWVRGMLEAVSRWVVLAVSEVSPDGAEEFVAFLPLIWHGKYRSYRVDQMRQLQMATDPAGDYTGFVCLPDHEQTAVPGLARFMANHMRWDRLSLRNINDPRLDRFADALGNAPLRIDVAQGQCCPYIPLPATWDEYLESLGTETRRTLRKRLRAAERECQVTAMDPADPDPMIDAMLALACMRQVKADDPYLPCYREVFRRCARAGSAMILMMHSGDQPVGSQGCFIDHRGGSLYLYMTGFDDQWSRISPGQVMVAHCIRYAIEQGFREVDFLRGDEEYKFRFGAKPRYNRDLIAVRRAAPTAARLALRRMRQTASI